MRSALIGLFAVLFFLSGCSDKEHEEGCVFEPNLADEGLAITFDQLQDALVQVKSKEELVTVLSREPLVRDYIFRRTEYPDDSVFINELYARFTNPHLDTLALEVKRVFGDGSALRKSFEDAFAHIRYYYPDFKAPKVKTLISGLDTDLFVSDTLIIVSLDFYLGVGAKYRPKTYDYLLRKYDPDDIVPSCLLMFGISDQFNKTSLQDKTVLADMIAYGKSFYFAKHMMPCLPDSTLIWYTPAEINGSRAHEDLIWARFIESKVLYETSYVVKKDYLGERPITVQVGEKCPGRIGQWVGWRIVNSYMKSHADKTLPQLMATEDAQQLFKESRYRPQ
jgi:hypothetical protein